MYELNKKLKVAIGLIIIAEIILTAYLVYGDISKTSGICVIGSQCDLVQNSKYSSIFGVKLSLFGTIAFIILGILYLSVLKNRKSWQYFIIANIIGAAFAFYFLYLQFFVIKAICSLCIVIDILAIFLAFIVLIAKKNDKENLQSLQNILAKTDVKIKTDD